MKHVLCLLLTLMPWLGLQADHRLEISSLKASSDTELLLKAMKHLKTIKGKKVLVLEPREYRFELRGDGKESPLIFDGVSDLHIEGRGAVLLAHEQLNAERGAFLRFTNFKNLSLSDLTVSYEPLPFIQGKIVKVDQSENKVWLKCDRSFSGVQHLKRSLHSEFWTRVGRVEDRQLAKVGNPSWMRVEPLGDGRLGRFEKDNSSLLMLRAGRVDAEAVLNAEQNWRVGEPMVVWKRGPQDALCFEGGDNLNLENIVVQSALHYAIKLRGVRGAVIKSCAVEPVEGGMISGSADGIDVQQSMDVVIQSNRLIATGDDMISLLNHGHGFNGEHHEQKFPSPYPETNVNIRILDNFCRGGNRNGFLLLGDRVVVEGNHLSGIRQYGIKFTGNDVSIVDNLVEDCGHFSRYRHIQDERITGIICSDEWLQSNILIERNTIVDWYNMPAILLKGVRDVSVRENCFMHRHSSVYRSIDFDILKSREPKALSSQLPREVATITEGVFRDQTVESTSIRAEANDLVLSW